LPASPEPTPGGTFGRVAEAYARTRPAYPRAAVDRAAAELGLGEGATVLDLASGTGTLTRALRERFARVIAVEPDAGMRARHEGDVLDGTAEEIPLEDGAVAAVFVGEAFHWFDYDRALAEIRRVAVSGLAILGRLWGVKQQPGLLPAEFERDLDEIWARFHGETTRRDFARWEDVVRPDGSAEFTETVRISGRDLVDLHLTASTPASIPALEREAIAARAYPLMDDWYAMRVVTELDWKRFS
jgi:ubiquinone/menaquinone biosynthesis C-methylase UbiE